MAIEEMHGTRLFGCVSVPLEDFIPRYSILIPTDPNQALSRRNGFFLTAHFRNDFLHCLPSGPAIFKERALFVWTLKVEASWAEAVKVFAYMKQAVSWGVLPPLIKWQEDAELSSIMPTDDRGALFLMSGKDSALKTIEKPVSFIKNRAGRHYEWWLDRFAPPDKECFSPGQVFLSMG